MEPSYLESTMTSKTAAPASTSTPPRPAACAGFRLGGMHLALPIGAVREIAPCQTLVPLRGMDGCVAGGLERGGTLIPVLDMRIALGQPVDGAPAARALIVAHGNTLLGLLAHEVSGVFSEDTVRAYGSGLQLLSTEALALAARKRVAKPSRSSLGWRAGWAWLRSLAWPSGARRPARPSVPAWGTPSAQLWDTIAPGSRGDAQTRPTLA